MAKKSKSHSHKSSWLKNLLLFLAITVLFAGLGVAGGAALGTFAIPFLGTAGGITLFGSIGFGLAMFVGLCAAIKGIQNSLSKSKNSNIPTEVEQVGLGDSLSLFDTTTQDNKKNQANKIREHLHKNSVINSLSNFFLGRKKTAPQTSALVKNNDLPKKFDSF